MGIRFEKDTILNWINEMGKFLRLLVDKWEDKTYDLEDAAEIEAAYKEFFQQDKLHLVGLDQDALTQYVQENLEDEQIRPFALLFMYDGLLSEDRNLLTKAKFLFEYYIKKTGNFSFEDAGHLAEIEKRLV